MSVSAEIITDTKENVLVIPNSAIKTRGKLSYVETFDKQYPVTAKDGSPVISSTLPRQQNIEVGITNDTETEVLSGLKLDDVIVIRTTSGTTVKKATPSAANMFGRQRGAQNGSVKVGR
jgi:multidrug efflux pump subunit AcrA (membrane-fusion protein)